MIDFADPPRLPDPVDPVELAELAAAVRASVGTPVSAVEPLLGFVGGQNALVRTPGGELVVKLGTSAAIAAESWACERVRRAGVPAPEIVAVEHERLARSYLVMRVVPGEPLDERDGAEPAKLTELGRLVRIVHGIPATGFGYLHAVGAASVVACGPEDSALAVARGPFARLDPVVRAGILPADLARRAREAVESYASVLDSAPGPMLLHGDLHPRHVYASSRRITGIIDWGDVATGDPAMEFGRFSRVGPRSLVALLAGYASDLDGNAGDPTLPTRIVLYRVVRCLQAIAWEWESGGDWFEAYVRTVAAGLDALDLADPPNVLDQSAGTPGWPALGG